MVNANVIRVKHKGIDITDARPPSFGFGLRPSRPSVGIALNELEVIPVVRVDE